MTEQQRNNIICVFADSAMLPFLGDTIRSLSRNSVICSRIVVVAAEASSLQTGKVGDIEGGESIPLEFVRPADFWGRIASLREGLGAGGFFFVSPGMSVPFAWDARLARVAQADAIVGTVSPFCDASPNFSLFTAPLGRQFSTQDLSRLDRLVFCLGERAYYEATTFFADCFYLSKAAFERLSNAPGYAKPDRGNWARYLTENGYPHVIADSVYVYKQPAIGNLITPDAGAQFESVDPLLTQVRNRVIEAFEADVDFKALPGLDGRPVQLHVTHDLGGGTIHWARSFSLADSQRINLILKPYSRSHAFGEGIALYSHVDDAKPLMLWQFSTPIQATAVTHSEYRLALAEIVSRYSVEAVLVSSLVGHSLDVMDTGLPTVVIAHDYYPYCPAINIYYGGVCTSCDDARLEDCHDHNRDFNPFLKFSYEERLLVRRRFIALAEARNITIVSPTQSVRNNLVRLERRFQNISFEIVAHGGDSDLSPVDFPGSVPNEKLRILVLGQLSLGKGSALLLESIDQVTTFAEVFLVGAGEVGELFRNRAGVHIVSGYQRGELLSILQGIRPDLGLLLSIVPETFSYTLSELAQLGIPVAATNVGSFQERVRHGEAGFLFEPNADALLNALRSINGNRQKLAEFRINLLAQPGRTEEEMVNDYHRILPLERGNYARYQLSRSSDRNDATNPADRNELHLSQALMLSSAWKEIKNLNLMLVLKEEVLRQGESSKVQHEQVMAEKDRQLAEDARQMAEKDRQLAEDARQMEEKDRQLAEDARQMEENDRQLAERDRQLAEGAQQLAERDHAVKLKDTQLAEIYSSTSWKISLPVRWVGSAVRKLRILSHCLWLIARDPRNATPVLLELFSIWRESGMLALKLHLVRLSEKAESNKALEKSRPEFALDIRPAIQSRISSMNSPPLISILMPTYNTPVAILRETIQSVLDQLYQNWELCIADDGSTRPHVRSLLRKYAAQDSRIKLYFGGGNKGVSYASNQALSLASGEFTVLLDHDDWLEEQAIFRVAECVQAEQPDMVYSDEALVSGDGLEALYYFFRPVFSPELLRSHPYIVHLAGFKTRLLREIGGFDENLSISQDYDLILRASERAQSVVHIPEILYRWRTHHDSAGHQKKHQVMEASKNVLRRHLERCGEKGWVTDGKDFNFFDTRYPLEGNLRVAIIIPTRNHGELVRQCIESIERTVHEIPFDIVLVDHASDDAASLEYFETLKARIQVLRYEGSFNFSTINNWAISRLQSQYSHYLLCNNDIEAIEPGWLERMVELGQKTSVGIVGAMLYYPDRKTIQHAGVCVGAYGAAEHYGKFMQIGIEPVYFGAMIVNHEVSAVTAACLLIRKEAFDEAGGFDEKLAVGFGDVDLCLRVGVKGYRVLFCPHAQLVHHESFTRGKSVEDPHPEDSAYFQRKWRSLLAAGDPYYNPNLAVSSTAWHAKLPMKYHLELRRRLYKPDRVMARQGIAHSLAGV